MELPTPGHVLAAVAAFVRDRLNDVGDTLAPILRRDEAAGASPPLVLVGATSTFAATSPARVRLLRQAYASGLLTAEETERAIAAETGSRNRRALPASGQPGHGALGASG